MDGDVWVIKIFGMRSWTYIQMYSSFIIMCIFLFNAIIILYYLVFVHKMKLRSVSDIIAEPCFKFEKYKFVKKSISVSQTVTDLATKRSRKMTQIP